MLLKASGPVKGKQNKLQRNKERSALLKSYTYIHVDIDIIDMEKKNDKYCQ